MTVNFRSYLIASTISLSLMLAQTSGTSSEEMPAKTKDSASASQPSLNEEGRQGQ
ncbi:hypothetical protein AB1K84_15600 [Mesobacillus foraminis]|uniref:hypothetical protein n=1 Tax=Mesobacillus foraminis TaxID=279826 RepID=UPI0039A04625